MADPSKTASSHGGARAPEPQLQDALEQLRIVTDSMSAAVARFSRDLRYVWVSKPYADWLDRRIDDIVGQPIVEVLGPPAFAAIRPHIDRVLAGERVEYEEQIEYPGIGLRWVHTIYTPTFGENHSVNGWVAVLVDVDERRGTEDALRRSEAGLQRLAAIVESSDDAIASKDLNGTVMSWNRAAERLFGYSAAEIIGRSIRTIIPADRQAEEDEVLRRIRRGESVEHFETVRQRKDGTQVPISLTVSPNRMPSGTIIGVSKIARDISDRKQAEARLRQLSTLIDLSYEPILVWDLHGGITEWNAGCEQLYGYSREEAVGRNSHELLQTVHPLSLPAFLNELATLGQWSGEVRHRTRDGREVVVASRLQVIETNGRMLVLETNRDVTARKQIEQAMADLQQRLLALVAASSTLLASPRVGDVVPATLALACELVPADGCAVWQLDTTTGKWRIGTHAGISEAFATTIVASYQVKAVSAASFSEPVVAEDVHAVPALNVVHDTYRSEGIVSLMAVPMTIGGRLTGSLVWYYRTRHRFSDVEIQTARALANLAGAAITTAELYDEQQRSREQSDFLARSGSVLASSLEYEDTLKRVAGLAVPRIADWCAVDVINDKGDIRRLAVAHVDPAKIQLAGSLQERYPDDPRSPYGIHEVLRTGKPVMMSQISDEMLVRTAVGDEHLRILRELGLVSYMCVPLLSGERVKGVLTFASAESGRHYSEADLRFAENVAARAVLAIASAEVYDELLRTNRLKDEFLATLSHELRTPLNAILGYARILRTGALPEERRTAAIEIVERNATSLTQIVEDVLDVSRIIAGKIRLNVQAVELPRVVDEAVATVRPAADAKGVRIQVIVDPRAAPVSGDPDRLQQVVWNLLSNAVKFTPRGGRVQVRLERIDSHVEIIVSDTGRGIAPEFLPHVFERFRQADSGFSREHGGLGLGLAIARSITELHGGTIHAASDGQGKGTTFRIRLPLMIVHAEPFVGANRVHPHADRAGTDATLPRLDDIRVLAVDDEEDSLSLLRVILEVTGAQVTTVCSGRQALEAIERQAPDVLVADIGMPGMDGFELIRRVRQSPQPFVRDLPAAALTAYARSEDRTRALRSGFQMHLAKPIDPGELVAAIATLTRRGNPATS